MEIFFVLKPGYEKDPTYRKNNEAGSEYLGGNYIYHGYGPKTPNVRILGDVPVEAPVGFRLTAEVILITDFPFLSPRKTGIYNYKNARGIVDVTHTKEIGYHHKSTITGRSYNSVRKLYEMIRAGTIIPTESWEEKQLSPKECGIIEKLREIPSNSLRGKLISWLLRIGE